MFLRFSIPLPAGHTLFRYCAARDLVAKIGDAVPNQDFVRSNEDNLVIVLSLHRLNSCGILSTA